MAEFNLDNIATDLNNKIGKGECVRYPVSKYCNSDASAWYIIYNDGWKECGGKATGVAYNSSTLITLPLPDGGFKDTNYTIIGSVVNTSTGHYFEGVYFIASSNTQAKMATSHNGGTAGAYPVRYYACGY